MRIVVVYREASDYARQVEELRHDFRRQTGSEIEVINPDSPSGANFCRAYGIVQYPTILALSHDSTMQQMWAGLPLPRINDLSYYN